MIFTKRTFLLLVSFVFLLSAMPLSIYAYSGGALNGKTLNVGSMLNNFQTTTTAPTDNNNATYIDLQNNGSSRDVLWYTFSSPISIRNFYVKTVSGFASGDLEIVLYDSSNSIIHTESLTSSLDGAVSAMPSTYNSVSSVLLHNKNNSVTYSIAEFDVFQAPDTTPPAVPTGLTATAGDGQVNLAWNAVGDSDLASYRIYRNGTLLTTVAKPATTYNVTGLTNGTSYSFQVSSFDSSGNESAKTAAVSATPQPPPDTTPPAVPTGLTATAGNGKVTLSWTANADPDIKEYEIYKDGLYFNSVQHPATTFEVSGLTNGTSYNFQLSAKDTSGNESAKTATVSATPFAPVDTTPPATPTGLSATAGDGKVTLSWTANTDPDISSYKIYRNGSYIGSANAPTTTYISSSLTNGTSYSYTLSAVDTSGNESAQSGSVSATPLAPAPETTGVTTSVSDGKVTLSWSQVVGAVKYYIYRNDLKIGEALSNGYTDSGLTNGQSYKYQISSVNGNNEESAKSTAVFAMPADVTDWSGIQLPFGVTDMLATAVSFISMYGQWILLVLGVIFVPALLYIVLRLQDKTVHVTADGAAGKLDRPMTRKQLRDYAETKGYKLSNDEIEKLYRDGKTAYKEAYSQNNRKQAGSSDREKMNRYDRPMTRREIESYSKAKGYTLSRAEMDEIYRSGREAYEAVKKQNRRTPRRN